MSTDPKTLSGAAIGAKVTIVGRECCPYNGTRATQEHTGVVTQVRHDPGVTFVGMRVLGGDLITVSCPWP